MMQTFVRTLLVLAFPPIMLWTFISKLMRGFLEAFYMAYLEVRIEIESFQRQWNRRDYLK